MLGLMTSMTTWWPTLNSALRHIPEDARWTLAERLLSAEVKASGVPEDRYERARFQTRLRARARRWTLA